MPETRNLLLCSDHKRGTMMAGIPSEVYLECEVDSKFKPGRCQKAAVALCAVEVD